MPLKPSTVVKNIVRGYDYSHMKYLQFAPYYSKKTHVLTTLSLDKGDVTWPGCLWVCEIMLDSPILGSWAFLCRGDVQRRRQAPEFTQECDECGSRSMPTKVKVDSLGR